MINNNTFIQDKTILKGNDLWYVYNTCHIV